MMTQTSQTPCNRLLQAEGELNHDIQAALERFREKVVLEAEAGGRKESTTKAVEQKEGPEKKFMFRESLLSIMFEIRDF